MWEDVELQQEEEEEENELTVKDLEIDESLSDVERIVHYATGHVALQRLVHVRILGRVAKEVGYSAAYEQLIPTINQYKKDSEPAIRKYLAAQLPHLIELCHSQLSNGKHENPVELIPSCLPNSESLRTSGGAKKDGDNIYKVSDELSSAAVVVELESGSSTADLGSPSNGNVLSVRKGNNKHKTESHVEDANPYRVILETLLPVLGELLCDEHETVRHAAGKSLILSVPFVQENDRMEAVAGLVLKCAIDHNHEERRILAASLLNQLAAPLGKEQCAQFIVPVVVSLSEDPIFRVRKAVALNIDSVFTVCDMSVIRARLFPAYVNLFSDPIWGVRKACLESIPPVSRQVGESERVHRLLPLLLKSLHDSSKWVKIAAYQYLGQFLSTLASEHIDKDLLDVFLDMPHTNTLGTESKDVPLSYFAAFSFPAVATAVGAARWDQLHGRYLDLVADARWRVRRSLAFSLHEMARLLGPDLASSSLIGPFKAFIVDTGEVKEGVVSHLADFIECLPPESRTPYLPLVAEVQLGSPPLQWRYRYLVAKQLRSIVDLFSWKESGLGLMDLVFNATADSVSHVRDAASTAVAGLLVKCREEKSDRDGFQEKICSQVLELGQSTDYSKRQQFVRICEHVYSSLPTEECDGVFGPTLEELSKDKVSNVRLAVAGMLSKCEPISESSRWQKCIDALKHDVDYDVAKASGCSEQVWHLEHKAILETKKRQREKEKERLAALVKDGLRVGPLLSQWKVPETTSSAAFTQPDAS